MLHTSRHHQFLTNGTFHDDCATKLGICTPPAYPKSMPLRMYHLASQFIQLRNLLLVLDVAGTNVLPLAALVDVIPDAVGDGVVGAVPVSMLLCEPGIRSGDGLQLESKGGGEDNAEEDEVLADEGAGGCVSSELCNRAVVVLVSI